MFKTKEFLLTTILLLVLFDGTEAFVTGILEQEITKSFYCFKAATLFVVFVAIIVYTVADIRKKGI